MGTNNRSRRHSGVYARDGNLVNGGGHRASATVPSPFVRSNERHLLGLRTQTAVSTLVGTVAAASQSNTTTPLVMAWAQEMPATFLRTFSGRLPVREGVPGHRGTNICFA